MLAALSAHYRPTRMQVGFVVLVLPSGTAAIAHIVRDSGGAMASVFFAVSTLHQFSMARGTAPILLNPCTGFAHGCFCYWRLRLVVGHDYFCGTVPKMAIAGLSPPFDRFIEPNALRQQSCGLVSRHFTGIYLLLSASQLATGTLIWANWRESYLPLEQKLFIPSLCFVH
jgi:hypothetical protein